MRRCVNSLVMQFTRTSVKVQQKAGVSTKGNNTHTSEALVVAVAVLVFSLVCARRDGFTAARGFTGLAETAVFDVSRNAALSSAVMDADTPSPTSQYTNCQHPREY
jgi:hypothetical protein